MDHQTDAGIFSKLYLFQKSQINSIHVISRHLRDPNQANTKEIFYSVHHEFFETLGLSNMIKKACTDVIKFQREKQQLNVGNKNLFNCISSGEKEELEAVNDKQRKQNEEDDHDTDLEIDGKNNHNRNINTYKSCGIKH